jgi:hypothetical protein
MQTPSAFYLIQVRCDYLAHKPFGPITEGFPTRAEAWRTFCNEFENEVAPTMETVIVIKIDLAEGTSRDVTEDWVADYTAPLDWSSHDKGRFGPELTRACAA